MLPQVVPVRTLWPVIYGLIIFDFFLVLVVAVSDPFRLVYVEAEHVVCTKVFLTVNTGIPVNEFLSFYFRTKE